MAKKDPARTGTTLRLKGAARFGIYDVAVEATMKINKNGSHVAARPYKGKLKPGDVVITVDSWTVPVFGVLYREYRRGPLQLWTQSNGHDDGGSVVGGKEARDWILKKVTGAAATAFREDIHDAIEMPDRVDHDLGTIDGATATLTETGHVRFDDLEYSEDQFLAIAGRVKRALKAHGPHDPYS